MSESSKAQELIAWRDRERKKHRTMTWGEYMAWCRGGDLISSPTETNPFPGGLTIILNTPAIIGIEHVDASEEARKSDLLPVPKGRTGT